MPKGAWAKYKQEIASGKSEKFTKTELLIAREIVKGKSNKEIADGLFVCAKTVRNHTTPIFQKAQVDGRPRFIAHYYLGFLPEILKAQFKPKPFQKSFPDVLPTLFTGKQKVIE